MTDKPIKAWYFSTTEKILRYGDDRSIDIGVTHEVDEPLEMCSQGLHASINILDALSYAPGPVIWKVELSGIKIQKYNKIVAQKRKYISGGIDISETLRKFVRLCALDVVDLWDAPDIVIRYLKTGDESIRLAAGLAAKSAARSVARLAADYSAESAAELAAKPLVGLAAKSAARLAAEASADSAAVPSARLAIEFAAESAIESAAELAGWSATEFTTWSVARSVAELAVRNKQQKRLIRMITRTIKRG